MTKDDILLALRLTAMGRAGHPLQEQLAESLERVFAAAPAATPAPPENEGVIDVEVAELRRARRKKAE
jgi:hypothetical protein